MFQNTSPTASMAVAGSFAHESFVCQRQLRFSIGHLRKRDGDDRVSESRNRSPSFGCSDSHVPAEIVFDQRMQRFSEPLNLEISGRLGTTSTLA